MTVEYVILSGARSAKSKNPKEKARFLDYARNDSRVCHSELAEESQKESGISRLRSK